MTALTARQTVLQTLADPLAERPAPNAENARSPRTVKAYQDAFADFRRWANARSEAILPAFAETASLYVADLAARVKSNGLRG